MIEIREFSGGEGQVDTVIISTKRKEGDSIAT